MSTNSTFEEAHLLAPHLHEPILVAGNGTYKVELKLYQVMLPILGGIIIGMNLIVVFSSGLILRKKLESRSTYLLLGNVAMADLMTGVAVIFGQYGPRRSEMVCCIEIGLIISGTLASVYSIGLIAVDRYLYILYGLLYKRYVSTTRARILVLATWLLGLVVGFLPAMGVRNTFDLDHCWFVLLEPVPLMLTTAFVGVVPLFVTIVLYGIILKQALRKIAEMRKCSAAIDDMAAGGSSSNRLRFFRGGSSSAVSVQSISSDDVSTTQMANSALQAGAAGQPKSDCWCCCRRRSAMLRVKAVYSPSRWKAIKIVLLTTGCYFVTWFPYFLACIIFSTCDPDQPFFYCDGLRIAIASPLAILGLANSLLNPIIYAWWHNGFRESARRAYHEVWQYMKSQRDQCGCLANTAARNRRPTVQTGQANAGYQAESKCVRRVEAPTRSIRVVGTTPAAARPNLPQPF